MDKYVKEKQLGRGSFGCVYLVRRVQDGQSTSSVLKEMAIQDANQRLSGRREIQLLSRLEHPNIIRYLDSFELEPNLVCLVMEYCRGGDLHSRIRRQRGIHFDESTIVSWTRQLCSALDYIHSLRILHRDVKSSNVFLREDRPDSTLKLGDFGVSKQLSATQDLATTCVGTPLFLSPEICTQRQYDAKSDIWGLGCVVYQLVCLKPPFAGANVKDLASKIVRGRFAPMPARYTYELRNAVAQMLRKNPDERPSAQTLLHRHPFQPQAKFKTKPMTRTISVHSLGSLAVYLPARKTPVKSKVVHPKRRQWKRPSETLIGALSSLNLMDKTWTVVPAINRSASLQTDAGQGDCSDDDEFQTVAEQDSPYHRLEVAKIDLENRLGTQLLKTVWSLLLAARDLETTHCSKLIQPHFTDHSTVREVLEVYLAEKQLYEQ